MESVDNRLKKIEQRLSSIEKFIAENYIKSKSQDLNLKLGRPAVLVEDVKDEYRYNYKADADPKNVVKAPLHEVDSSYFNTIRQVHTTDQTINMAVGGVLILLFLYILARVVIDVNFISATGQISFAVALGFTFIGVGYGLRDSEKYYVRYIPIIGLIVLYIAVYGATNFYQIMPKNVGLLAVLGISGISIFLNQQLKLIVFQILAVIGAYVMPLYISFASGLLFINFYYLIASLFFTFLAVWLELIPTAILSAYLAIFVCVLMEYVDNDIMNKILFTMGHFVFFACGYVLYVVRTKKTISKAYSYAFFPLILLFYAVENSYIQTKSMMMIPVFALGTSGLLFALGAVVKKFSKTDKLHLISNLLICSGIIVSVHAFLFVLLPTKIRTIVLVLASFGLFKFIDDIFKDAVTLKRMVSIMMLGLLGWTYFEVLFTQFNSKSHLPLVNGFIFTLVLGYVTVFEKFLGPLRINSVIALSIGHASALVTLYNIFKTKPVTLLMGILFAYAVFAALTVYLTQQRHKSDERNPQSEEKA